MYHGFCDTSSYPLKGIATIGFVLYSPTGEIVHKESQILKQYMGSQKAELFAIEVMLAKARELNIKNIVVYSDNRSLIEIANQSIKIKNRHIKRLNRLKMAAEQFDSCYFKWIKRNKNKIAHKLCVVK